MGFTVVCSVMGVNTSGIHVLCHVFHCDLVGAIGGMMLYFL
jgi:hypothetical protein